MQLRSTALLPGAGLSVSGVELTAGPASVRLERGTIFPAGAIGDRSAEFVFIGSGRLQAVAPDDIEAGQLELFTGQRELDLSFTEAVLVVPLDSAAALLTARPAASEDPAGRGQAVAAYGRWRQSPVRESLDVDGVLLLDALGDPVMQGFFAGWFQGAERREVYCAVDPEADEQFTAGQFVTWEVTEREKRKLRKALHSAQRQGRLLGLEVEDLGQFDTWISASLRDPAGKLVPGVGALVASHYTIDLKITRDDRRLHGRVEIDLSVTSAGRRGGSFSLNRDLEVTQVLAADGTALPFSRSGSSLTVVFPGPTHEKQRLRLRIDYSGRPLAKEKHRVFALTDTVLWFPRPGFGGRATFDATFHYPATYDLLASGVRRDQGDEEGGMRWERRTVDVPTDYISFEVGDFVTQEAQAGNVRVLVAFDRDASSLPPVARDKITDVVTKSLSYFEEIFGPYPLDHLTVVTSPRPYSQGFLGFVTLADSQIGIGRAASTWIGEDDVATTIAHEIAHQWWGNLVGFPSYRDQWLSEAMANYASILFARNRLQINLERSLRPIRGWEWALSATTEDGRTVESLGPVVLGQRLDSSKFGAAYAPVVYLKGAMILRTLARVFREDVFLTMLGHLVKAAAGRDLGTEGLIASVERMSGRDLGWFSRQYVYGTGWPEVEYSYAFEQTTEGAWRVKGVARQRVNYRFRYRVEPTSAGGFDAARLRVADKTPAAESHLVVPFDILVKKQVPTSDSRRRKAEEDDSQLVQYGRVLLSGETSTFSVETEYQPVNFWLDRHAEVLASFSCETRSPRSVIMYRGLDHAAAGEWEAAETALRQALAAPLEFDPSPDPEGPSPVVQRTRERRLDGRIHLAMARLLLDQGRDEAARSELQVALDRLGQSDRWIFEPSWRHLQARLAMRRGEYDEPFKRLRKYLFPTADDVSTEGIVLLAIAAHGAGRTEEYERAVELAEKRGADLTALKNR